MRIVNLWNAPQFFRVDGRCGPRWTPRMFKLPSRLSERSPVMHRSWFPEELEKAPKAYANAYLYHLRMIDRADRQARYEKFRLIDPQNAHQSFGYQHLVNEANLVLRPVRPWRAYVDLPPLDRPASPAAVSAPPFPDRSEFDEAYYLCRYPDIRRAVTRGHFDCGWQHFRQHGLTEGRLWRRSPRLSGLDFDAIFRERRSIRRRHP
ncbi:MAG: hypothetical protein R3D05_03220 [Dongiaceae bacterium]